MAYNAEIIEKINTILAEEFEKDPETIRPEAPLMETLGLDSLDLVDVVVIIEQHFGVVMTSNDFIGVRTFQDFYDLVIEKTGKAKK